MKEMLIMFQFTFPTTCWMKTKRGIYDFAFNLQEIMDRKPYNINWNTIIRI